MQLADPPGQPGDMRGVDPGEQGCRPGGADLHDRGAGALGVGGGVGFADQDPAAVQPPGAARYHGHAVGVQVAVAGDGRGHRADRGQGVQERCRAADAAAVAPSTNDPAVTASIVRVSRTIETSRANGRAPAVHPAATYHVPGARRVHRQPEHSRHRPARGGYIWRVCWEHKRATGAVTTRSVTKALDCVVGGVS